MFIVSCQQRNEETHTLVLLQKMMMQVMQYLQHLMQMHDAHSRLIKPDNMEIVQNVLLYKAPLKKAFLKVIHKDIMQQTKDYCITCETGKLKTVMQNESQKDMQAKERTDKACKRKKKTL